MDPFLKKILENTFTLSQLKHRVHILREYISQGIFGSLPTEAAAVSDLNWIGSLGDGFLSQFTKDNITGIFKNLETYIQSVKPLIIYLAFEPNEELNRLIGQYLRKNFTGYPIFEAKTDPKLIAGCALSINGIYKDYSLRIKIEDKREKILESFKKFL